MLRRFSPYLPLCGSPQRAARAATCGPIDPSRRIRSYRSRAPCNSPRGARELRGTPDERLPRVRRHAHTPCQVGDSNLRVQRGGFLTTLNDSALPHKWAPDLAEDGWRKDRGQGETNSKSWKVSSVRREPSSRLLFPPPPHPHPSLLRGDPSLYMKLCRLYMVWIKPYMWHVNKSFYLSIFESNFRLLNLKL